jgi:hypothetical protein
MVFPFPIAHRAGCQLKVEENRPDEAPTRTEGVPKGRDFDNPRRQPGEHGLKIM